MKQESKKLFTHYASRITHHGSGGFTLIELAMVMVVIGLLIGLGMSLIGPLTKRAKLIETRETVKQAKEAVLGYAVKNGYLPANLEAAGARKLDAWTRDLQYYAATELASPANACSKDTTSLTVYECTNTDCSSFLTKSNIAFVIYSNGEDADGACTGTASPFYVREQAMGYNSPCTYTTTNPQFNYDDVVAYVSLDEIRSLRGCPQPLVITSPVSPATLTEGEEDSFYSYSLQAMGGMPPYTWGTWSAGACDTGTLWSGSGLSLNNSGLISGTINVNSATSTGELTACSANIDADNICVRDSANGSVGPRNFDIPVRPKPLSITNTELPSTTVGVVNPNYARLIGIGGRKTTGASTSYSWSLSGFSGSACPSDPSWLTRTVETTTGDYVLGINNPTTAGTCSFAATLSDGCGSSTSKRFTITVNAAAAGAGLSCTLTATSPINAGSYSTLTWAINNGPADGTFNPTSGTCTNFTSSSGGNCTTTALYSTTTFGLTVTKGSETSSCAVTVYVNPTPVAPSCTLEASPNPVTIGNPTTLIWTINNGPATATFSPTSGACGTFTNSYGGNCNTNNINANTTFQLTVTRDSYSGICATTVYATSQDFCSTITVRNVTGGNIYVKGGQYGATCRRIRDNRTFNVNYSDTTQVTLWQNSSCTSNPQDIDSVSHNNSIPADAYAAPTDADRDCAVALDEVATNDWELVDE